MLDIKFIREHPEKVKQSLVDRGVEFDMDYLLDLDERHRAKITEVDDLRARQNAISEEISTASGSEREQKIAESRGIKETLSHAEFELKALEEEFLEKLSQVPTIPSPDTPFGKSDVDNIEIHKWGKQKKFDFAPKDHTELGTKLDIFDFERGAKVAGYRGYYLKNEGALLALALMQYALSKLVGRGYTPVIPPTLVKGFALYGSGYFKGEKYDPLVDEIYRVEFSKAAKHYKYLVGTAEPSLLAYYSGEVLEERELPIRLGGFSQCYRSEIGSYGKDTKGIYRVHEFMKVEQVILCRADVKEAEHLQEEMIGISRELHEELGIPYRQIIISTGDLGIGKYRQYDLEAWLPGMNRYGETGSASIFLDWQSRRLNVKYADKAGKRNYVYMLNNTALPTPRILIAILENYQQADGSIEIPKVLQPYMGGIERIVRK